MWIFAVRKSQNNQWTANGFLPVHKLLPLLHMVEQEQCNKVNLSFLGEVGQVHQIPYSAENAKIVNKLVNARDKKIINNLGIKSNYISFKLVNNDPFLAAEYLNEDELFTWFKIIEELELK